MERLHYRSTSLLDLQAELREQDLLRASRQQPGDGPPTSRARRRPFRLSLLTRRLWG